MSVKETILDGGTVEEVTGWLQDHIKQWFDYARGTAITELAEHLTEIFANGENTQEIYELIMRELERRNM